jgi:hypothetical protein
VLLLATVVGAGVAGRVLEGNEVSQTTANTAPQLAIATPGATRLPAADGADPDAARADPESALAGGPSSVWRLGGDGVIGSRGVDLGDLRRRGDDARPTLRFRLPGWFVERRQL